MGRNQIARLKLSGAACPIVRIARMGAEPTLFLAPVGGSPHVRFGLGGSGSAASSPGAHWAERLDAEVKPRVDGRSVQSTGDAGPQRLWTVVRMILRYGVWFTVSGDPSPDSVRRLAPPRRSPACLGGHPNEKPANGMHPKR